MIDIQALTSQDRCDACGAQAVLAVSLGKAKTPLLFCGHHSARHRVALTKVADVVWDTSGRVVFDRQDKDVVHIP